MERLYRISAMRRDPCGSIVWVVALAAIIGGLYIFSPFLVLNPPTNAGNLFEAVASKIGIAALAGGSWASAAMMIYGLLKKHDEWIARGLFLNMTMRIYAFLVQLLVYGFVSSWISSVTLILICLVLYLAYKVKR